ncbi:DNA-directed RNA polymerase subunit omega [Caproiciproducens galactitolivorans]|jgi:DNA-directed RNA polymerase subunit omega|uniref:DNA-directed RNA polymerase subunit omega n=1 Tax=Caproiciproducens galactitolivorans TaxID=642589 RepID=A0A4Z0Y9D1_9FIRM|nr:DNA-directed RNA polymerase subunit omega [Caproiciproducens galactitolivorans]QEY34031.1 DNA-directed RNA polymerase subunit omega [Caproiciproducens galactitolivorans]TGJ76558.1 DNA-directed RNA polymerase subunit omega [Caproiciproducens galactitolivorans]
MLKPSADLIIGPDQSRYSLVVAVSKRAREIASEAEEKGEILTEKPVDLAVHELMEHKYIVVEPKQEASE